MKRISIIFILLGISVAVRAEEPLVLEQLMGVNVDENGISFQVNSNGCTYRRNFNFHVEERLEQMGPNLPAFEHHYYITARRLQPDACDSYLPYGTRIFISFEELQIQFGKYHVQNPIGGEKIIAVP